MKYISLLRGINVAGKNVVKMADLKELYLRVGFGEVKTYIQSGNVIFYSEKRDIQEVERIIESAIFLDYNFDVPVQVIPVLKMKKVEAQNPFITIGLDDVKKLHVTFLEKVPDEESVKALQELVDEEESEDKFMIVDDVVYIHCPGSYAKTKLSNQFFEKQLNMKATTRNWKSVCKMVDLSR